MCFSGGKDPKKPSDSSAASSCSADPKEKAIDDAIAKIERSNWAKTEEGKKVLAKIKELRKDDKIKHKNLPAGRMGEWSGGEIGIPGGTTDSDFIASELVHEATHALHEDEFPRSKTKFTIDEEMRTNTNQLDFYEEQRRSGFRSAELDRRRSARKKGKLRDDVRKRYQGLPEHL